MRLKRYWQHYHRFTPRERRLLWRCACWCTVFAVLKQFIPFKYLIRSKAIQVRHPHDAEQALMIGRFTRLAAKRLPFPCLCLVQALTARRCLHRVGIPCTLTLGVTKNSEVLKAHAWCQVNDLFITGRPGYEQFSIIEQFTSPIKH